MKETPVQLLSNEFSVIFKNIHFFKIPSVVASKIIRLNFEENFWLKVFTQNYLLKKSAWLACQIRFQKMVLFVHGNSFKR